MGITIGDALSVVSTILAICISSWALIVCIGYLFGAKSSAAQIGIEKNPWKTGLVGALFLAPSGFIATVFAVSPVPIIKLVGLISFFMLIVIAGIGAAALSTIVADRMVKKDPRIQHNHALGRAAALIIAACVMPVIGWFVLAPILLLVCTGAGATALIARQTEKAVHAESNGA